MLEQLSIAHGRKTSENYSSVRSFWHATWLGWELSSISFNPEVACSFNPAFASK